MDEFKDAGSIGEIPIGQMRGLTLDGREILLAHVGDTIYAVDRTCPHLGGDLSRGTLDGTVVTCPRHHSQFDLRDGHVIRWTDFRGIASTISNLVRPPRPLRTYEVKVEADRILVRLR